MEKPVQGHTGEQRARTGTQVAPRRTCCAGQRLPLRCPPLTQFGGASEAPCLSSEKSLLLTGHSETPWRSLWAIFSFPRSNWAGLEGGPVRGEGVLEL